eukprot:641282-Rhodomonas_salina.1
MAKAVRRSRILSRCELALSFQPGRSDGHGSWCAGHAGHRSAAALVERGPVAAAERLLAASSLDDCERVRQTRPSRRSSLCVPRGHNDAASCLCLLVPGRMLDPAQTLQSDFDRALCCSRLSP